MGENKVECAFFFTAEQLVSGRLQRFYRYMEYFARLGLYSERDFKKALLNKLFFHPLSLVKIYILYSVQVVTKIVSLY